MVSLRDMVIDEDKFGIQFRMITNEQVQNSFLFSILLSTDCIFFVFNTMRKVVNQSVNKGWRIPNIHLWI